MNLSKAARQQLGHNPQGEEFDIQWRACEIDQEVMRKLGFDFIMSRHWKWYGWICQQYLTKDFTVADTLKLAYILEAYPYEVIAKAVKIARTRGIFTVPYLAGILAQEGAQMVEDGRREQRLVAAILQSDAPTYPKETDPQLVLQLYEHTKLRDNAKD